jgi:hypothetical protein
MEENRQYRIFPSNLNVVNAVKQFSDYLKKSGYVPSDFSKGCKLSLEVDQFRTISAENWFEYIDLLERYPSSLPSFNYGWTKKGENGIAAAVTFFKSNLIVSVRSIDHDKVAGLHEVLKTILCASNLPVINNKIRKYDLKKTIFLAHKFDESGNEIARIIDRFCSLLGFDIKDGMGYESKIIPDKVTERIQSQDVFIGIFTEGKPDWLISELAYAKGLNKYLIILAESNQDVSKGIVGGDFEHISFPIDNPYKCLIDLLYALPF